MSGFEVQIESIERLIGLLVKVYSATLLLGLVLENWFASFGYRH